MFPDAINLGKRIFKSRGRGELQKVIFRALDIEQELNEAETEDADVTDQKSEPAGSREEQKEDVRPEQIIIENLLDSIF